MSSPVPHLFVAMAGAGLSACASAPETSGLRDREIADYVTGHWSDFTMRAAYLAGRPEVTNALVSVTDVDCQPYEDIMKCRFSVRIRFSDGVVASPVVDGLFGRESDGTIAQYLEVIPAPA